MDPPRCFGALGSGFSGLAFRVEIPAVRIAAGSKRAPPGRIRDDPILKSDSPTPNSIATSSIRIVVPAAGSPSSRGGSGGCG
jgi:hypothetical protein